MYIWMLKRWHVALIQLPSKDISNPNIYHRRGLDAHTWWGCGAVANVAIGTRLLYILTDTNLTQAMRMRAADGSLRYFQQKRNSRQGPPTLPYLRGLRFGKILDEWFNYDIDINWRHAQIVEGARVYTPIARYTLIFWTLETGSSALHLMCQ